MDQQKLVTFLLLFGIFQGLALAIILVISKRHRKQSNILLALFLLSYSFKLLLNTPYSPSIGIGNYLVSILLIGPFLLLYVRSVVHPKLQLQISHLWHLAPAIVYLVVINYLTTTYQITGYQQIFNDQKVLMITSLLQGLVALQALLYVLASVFELRKYRQWAINHHSHLATIDLNWLRWLTYLFLGITLLWYIGGYADIGYFIQVFGEPSIQMAYVFWASMSAIVLVIGYYGLLRPEMFIDRQPESTTKSLRKLSTSEINQHKQKLLELMENERPYLDPKLKLTDLAQMMEVNTGVLSLVINQGTGQNFNDFVNQYRVNEFKNRVRSGNHDQYTLLAIALDSGFNSKSTFNAIFKKFTGATPNQFRNQLS